MYLNGKEMAFGLLILLVLVGAGFIGAEHFFWWLLRHATVGWR